MNVLVLNAGSSSLRFQIIQTDADLMQRDVDRRLAHGLVERIGGHAICTLEAEGQGAITEDAPLRDHRAAIERVLDWVISDESGIEGIRALADIHAVGHRVVHGGQLFQRSARVDDEVIAGIESCIELAPLHNPANLRGIRAVKELLGPDLPQVAVFDTAFHATMPECAYLYALPYHYYRRLQVRRYGFHGTSHRYVAYRYRKLARLPRNEVHLITIHLGNGCSACAIQAGNSFDTSMGFTPLDGLIMGTRCGDLDPSIVEYLVQKDGLTLHEVEGILNKQSGLLGISGLTADMRDLQAEVAENGDRRAKLAIDMFCWRVRKYIGAYAVELDGPIAVVFTGGIGENAPAIREQICRGLGRIGLMIDPERNDAAVNGRSARISTDTSEMTAYVIPTNEELLIARDTVRVLEGVIAPRVEDGSP
ncbi:Acetate kinase [Planctomycetes bacterium Poly30]|uniref:Acetate kinase n=1 Tax=Saltatorellus ferox TaxID=2528018 RepID=A0A518EVK1_9BACT|nr:Acetate kinase [Planctomycetes bacterium Poly30]